MKSEGQPLGNKSIGRRIQYIKNGACNECPALKPGAKVSKENEYRRAGKLNEIIRLHFSQVPCCKPIDKRGNGKTCNKVSSLGLQEDVNNGKPRNSIKPIGRLLHMGGTLFQVH